MRGLASPGALKDAVSGTWLGHALHPPLTDVVIGSFVSATLLDLTAGDSDEAAERLLQVGIAAAVPTALTGTNDYADSEPADPRVRRVGLVHAGLNATALGLQIASLAARRSGARGRGKALSLASTALLTTGGFLGGHLSYALGVGPNQTAFDEGPEDWTPVADASQLRDGEPTAAMAGDTPVLLVRHRDGVHAIHDRCSHRGCLLSEGELDGHTVTCACHGSQFDVRDGTLLRGPATTAQPAFETRQAGDRIEVRLHGG